QRTGAVGQHETVTPLVPWATRCRRVIIASGQGTGGSETTDPQTAGSHFRATGNHHVRLAVGDVAGSHADAMRTGGTGGGDGVIRPLKPQVNRQEAGDHVDDRAWHEERGNAPRTLLEQRSATVLDIRQPTDPGTHGNADPLPVLIGDLQAGIAHGLETGRQTVLNEQVQLARFLGREILLDIEVFDRSAKTGGEGGQIHVLDQADTTTAGENPLPAARHIVTQWRYHAHPGNHDASTRHSNSPYVTFGSSPPFARQAEERRPLPRHRTSETEPACIFMSSSKKSRTTLFKAVRLY